jgi:integrase/recombinase XerD
MNALNRAVTEYLDLRRALGFRLKRYHVWLREFVALLNCRKAHHITTALAVEFATRNTSHGPKTRSMRYQVVRGFARYYHGIDAVSEVPPPGVVPGRSRPAHPYLYTDEEIRALLCATRNLPSAYPLRPWTYCCLFGLLAVSGMRISEALNLLRRDIDWNEGLLTVQKAKFGKSRLIPLHPSTVKVLETYARQRDHFFAEKHRDPGLHFFVTRAGTRLNDAYVHRVFWRVSRAIGIREAGASHGPRLHDFRHRFAIETLLRWYDDGQPVDRRLPVLSTYLGHVRVTDTYWYLRSTPKLMAAAAKRLDRRWKGLR